MFGTEQYNSRAEVDGAEGSASRSNDNNDFRYVR